MKETPAPIFRTRLDYSSMIESIWLAGGQWIELELDQLNGDDIRAKQNSVTQAASSRKIKVQTSTEDGRLYARLKVFTPAASVEVQK